MSNFRSNNDGCVVPLIAWGIFGVIALIIFAVRFFATPGGWSVGL